MKPGRLPPMPPSGRTPKNRPGSAKDYSPVLWSGYFESLEDIQLDEKTSFRVYKSKDSGHENRPVLFLLHGGGFSALTWSLLSVEMTDIIHCQCVAVDLRGHGDTVTEEDDDLSAETLSQDIGRLYKKMFPENPPPVLLVGHSMGGAIAVHVAHRRLIDTLIGVTVIDVVEGSAMEALTSMQTFLRSRPTHFKSIPQAIEWSVRSGQIRNVDSARVSMPGQILNAVTRRTATNELPLEEEPNTAIASVPAATNPMTIKEDEEFDAGSIKPPETNKNYTWRIDLTKSEKFWTGWFEGLSEMFLNLAVPKLLLLASIDGLDRTLTVGQMQGKFQMQVLARSGHAVQEDRPHEVAEVIGSFMVRNKFAEAANDFVQVRNVC